MNKRFVRPLLFLIFCFLSSGPLLAKENPVIEEGRKVKLQYILKSEGKVVEKSGKNSPLEFEYGKDPLLPVFRKNILGMKAGEKKKFEMAPEDAFGSWDSSMTRVIPRSQLPDKKLKPGMALTATYPDRMTTLTGHVSKIIGDEVLVDFNHPLAGKTVQVEFKVIEVR